MRWIDFENKKPTDMDLPGWTPWTDAEWKAWQDESTRLLGALTALNAAGKIKERNELIDVNSKHWSDLKPWLFALSHGKCWFTEARDIASHQDVEHFRPKKEALDLKGKTRDGYWWLAFDYSNYRAAGNVPNRKKGGWFPLEETSLISTFSARCEASEVPYLLDPINPNDPGLLAFDEEGNAIPVPGADDWTKERVRISVERLKLNDHDALPAERRRVWQDVTGAIEVFLTAKAAYHPKTNPAPKVTMDERARFLFGKTRKEAELSSVARWCLLLRNDPDLSRLALNFS